MNPTRVLVVLLLVSSASIIAIPRSGPVDHSQARNPTQDPTPGPGIVCIASSISTACPLSSNVIPGPLAGPTAQFEVAIIVNSSQTVAGFDITLVTNSSVLKPAGVSPGTLLTGTHEIVKCIGGINKLGTNSCPSTDTSNTIEYAVVSDVTINPVTGVLFNAIFNVTANTPSSPVTFQTGCTNTSVTGGICVSISDGTPFLVPETVQTARFSNLPYYQILTSTGSMTVAKGDTDLTQFITVSSLNGFGGTTGTTVSLTTSVTPSGPTFNVSPTSVIVAVGSDALAALNVTVPITANPGIYTLNVTGSSGTLPSNSITILLNVPVPDFSITPSTCCLRFNATYATTLPIMITSIGNFAGNVALRLTSQAAINATFSNSMTNQTLELSSKGTNSTTVTVRSVVAGGYVLNITGTSGSVVHILSVPILVSDFRMEALIDPLEVVNGSSSQEPIVITATSRFYNATVSIGPISINRVAANGTLQPSNGISVSCTPTSVQIVSMNIILGGNMTVCLVKDFVAGTYQVAVGASAGSGIHTSHHSVTFTVIAGPPPPTFTISVNPRELTVNAGQNTTVTVTITSINGFAGPVTLASLVSFGYGIASAPTTTLRPSNVTLEPGGNQTSTLQIATTVTTTVSTYTVDLTGISGNLVIGTFLVLTVGPPQDIPPVASFSVNPPSLTVGESAFFDGTSSYDPDGTVIQWVWNFGDGSGQNCCGSTTYHTFSSLGNFTVTLTVTDNAGLTGTTSMMIKVRAQPAHDVSVVYVATEFSKVPATSFVGIAVELRNDGFSNETVTVTAYANGRAVQVLTGVFIQGCRINQSQPFCYDQAYLTLFWDTTGAVPGNYTISASVLLPAGEVDPTPSDNSITDGVVTILPAPVLTVSSVTGNTGTQVTVQGTGFLFAESLWVTFDDMFIGEAFNVRNGTFTFTFDIPQAQPGAHTIKALDLHSGTHASTTFTVTSTPTGSLAVTVSTGSVYFPGDTVVVYVFTTFNGVLTANSQVTVQLVFSNGTSRNLSVTPLATGLYMASYTVLSAGPLGTYAIIAKAHMTGPIDVSSLTTFEVKLSWLSSNKNKIVGGAVALAGILGLVAVVWKKGYLRRRDEPESSSPPL